MDKGLTMPKWVLIDWPKIPQMPQNLPVCPSPLVLDFSEKTSLGVHSPCAGLFFAQSDKFNVIPSFNFSKSNFAQKKLRTYVLLECIRALQNPKGFKLHLQKPPFT